jgi:site-specific recombinase XerD
MLGKPRQQSTDHKYYIALSYVGVRTADPPASLKSIVLAVPITKSFTLEEVKHAIENDHPEEMYRIREGIV